MKKQQLLLVIIFCLLVFAMPVLFLMNQRVVLDSTYADQNFEKRTPTPLPDIRQTGISAWPEAMEEYFRDHLPLRHTIIRGNAMMDKELFSSTTSLKIHLGKDGWLFFKDHPGVDNIADYQGILPLDEALAAQTIALLEQLAQQQAAQNCRTVLLLPPNKEAVYGEYLPDGIPQLDPTSRSDRLLALAAQSAPDVVVADPKPALLKLAETDKQLYYKTDTHWTTRGAYVGMTTILEALGEEAVPYQSDDFYKDGSTSGDLGALGALDLKNEASFSRRWEQSVTVTRSGEGSVVYYESDAADSRRVLVLGDSFRYHLQEVLPYLFAHTAFAALSDMDAAFVQAYAPDILIVEQVERNLGNFALYLPQYLPA